VNYVVQVVGEDELPEGRHVVIVERDEGPPLMLINGPPARTWSLMRAYEDTCESSSVPSILRLAV